MALEQKLEAVLFYKGEPETRSRLANLLNVSEDEIDKAALKLAASLATHGIRLLSVNNQIELITAPETSDVINNIRKDELVRDLGKAGAETFIS